MTLSDLRSLLLCLACLALTAVGRAQPVSGRVVDATTREPLAFVHVVPAGEREGTTTDIDGRFQLVLPGEEAELQFSYVGYAPHVEHVMAGGSVVVQLQRATFELRSVEVLPGENPAHRIIMALPLAELWTATGP